MLQRDPAIEKLLQLNEEVAKFAKEVKRENIERKKNKYIARSFCKRRPVAPLRSIKKANLFKEIDIEDTPAYFEYQLLCRVRNEAASQVNSLIDDKKEAVSSLPWRRSSPRIISKFKPSVAGSKYGREMSIDTSASRVDLMQPADFSQGASSTRSHGLLHSRGGSTLQNRLASRVSSIRESTMGTLEETESQDPYQVFGEQNVRKKAAAKVKREKAAFVKKFKESLMNPIMRQQCDMSDVKNISKHIPVIPLVKFKTLDGDEDNDNKKSF